MILRIALKNLLHQPLSSLLSWLLLTVSTGIISLLFLLQQQVEQQFTGSIEGIDMVIGAKGSPLQLILSAVYHVDAPTGNISQTEAGKWMRHPFIEKAIPLAYGDSYKGYSIVGTTEEYLHQYHARVQQGRLFQADFEVVAGHTIARKLQLQTGSSFYGTHGGKEGGEQHEEHAYKLTGILEPTGTVADNLLLCNIKSVWEMHGHHEGGEHKEGEHEGGKHEEGEHHDAGKEPEEDHEADRQLTALIVKFRTPMAAIQLPRLINEKTNMMAALPAIEINRLFSLLGIGIDTLQNIGWGILLLSGISVFIALFNSLKERKYEMALMRSMGAHRGQLFTLLLLEGLLLAALGYIAGLATSRIAMAALAPSLQKDYHFTLRPWQLLWPQEGWLFAVILGIVLLASLLPAIKAGFINISKTLSHE